SLAAGIGSPATLASVCALFHVPVAILDDLTSPRSDLLLRSCACCQQGCLPSRPGTTPGKCRGNQEGFGGLQIGELDRGREGLGGEGRFAGLPPVQRWAFGAPRRQ